MQIQIKKQLKIELDQADIIEAVGDLLTKHGQRVSQEELTEIIFVKSPKDGLRASLSITEQTGTDFDQQAEEVVLNEKKPTLEKPVEPIAEPEPAEAETEAEEPGEVETSTVEDVMPSVDEVAAMRDTQPEETTTTHVDDEEAVEAPVEAEEPRKSLFL